VARISVCAAFDEEWITQVLPSLDGPLNRKPFDEDEWLAGFNSQ
jgi:hypothetical protein